jgi:hypothetical protein
MSRFSLVVKMGGRSSFCTTGAGAGKPPVCGQRGDQPVYGIRVRASFVVTPLSTGAKKGDVARCEPPIDGPQGGTANLVACFEAGSTLQDGAVRRLPLRRAAPSVAKARAPARLVLAGSRIPDW